MRLQLTANITTEEAQLLDHIIKAAGFENRTDYFTALIHTTLYGITGYRTNVPQEIESWIADNRIYAELRDRMCDIALEVLDKIAFPAIAMKGRAYALEHIGKDIEAAIFDRCGVLPGPDDLKHYLRIYQNIRRPDLLHHRTRELAEEYQRNRENQ